MERLIFGGCFVILVLMVGTGGRGCGNRKLGAVLAGCVAIVLPGFGGPRSPSPEAGRLHLDHRDTHI